MSVMMSNSDTLSLFLALGYARLFSLTLTSYHAFFIYLPFFLLRKRSFVRSYDIVYEICYITTNLPYVPVRTYVLIYLPTR